MDSVRPARTVFTPAGARPRRGAAGVAWSAGAALLLALAAVLFVTLVLPATAAAVYKPVSFDDVDFVSKNVGFAVGTPGSLYATTDGGLTWSHRPLGTADWLTSVDFVSAQRGWVLGIVNEGEPARIWHTRDGGRHWAVQPNPSTCDVLTGVVLTSSRNGVIVGRHGTILRTTDGGDSWSQVDSGTADGLDAVDFPTAGVGYATGEEGRLVKSVDGGAHWTSLSTGVGRDLRALSFVSAKLGWAVGIDGAVLRTKNGGASWTKQPSGVTKALAGVDFVDPSHGWAVGDRGTILRTTNGGGLWKKQKSGTTAFLHAVDFVTASRGYVAGEKMRPPGSDPYAYGVIRRTTSGGTVWLNSF